MSAAILNLFNDLPQIFAGVKFCTMPPIQKDVKEALRLRGASDHGNFLNRNITHLVCDNAEFQRHIKAEYIKPPDMNFDIVTSDWVKWSILCGTKLPSNPFSYTECRIFDGLVFSIQNGSDNVLSPTDRAKLWAMIVFYGGQFTCDTHKCTHLIVSDCPYTLSTTDGSTFAMQSFVKLVTPDFISHCIISKSRLDETNYDPAGYKIVASGVVLRRLSIRTNNFDWWNKLSSTRQTSVESVKCIRSFKANPQLSKIFKGSNIFICDYENIEAKDEISRWKDMIRSRGGEVIETSTPQQQQRATHIICENIHSQLFKRALACGQIKLVTKHWLMDVMLMGQLLPPWLPYHFPHYFSQLQPAILPLRRHMVHVEESSYDPPTRIILFEMIKLLGGLHSTAFSAACSIIISNSQKPFSNSKQNEGESNGVQTPSQSLRALRVNQRWIIELFFGVDLLQVKTLPNKYTDPDDDCTIYHFDRIFVSEFFPPWMTIDPGVDIIAEALKECESEKVNNKENQTIQANVGFVNRESLKARSAHNGNITKTSHSDLVEYSKRGSLRLVEGVEIGRKRFEDGSTFVIAITGFTERQLRELHLIVHRLPNSKLAPNDFESTHLVAKSLTKTSRFLTCISVASYVLNYKWILDSKSKGYFIHPPEPEHQLEDTLFNEKLTLNNAMNREKPMFNNLSFFCMPGIKPSTFELRNPILAAGGKCLTDITQVLRSPKNSIVIASPKDIEVLEPLLKKGVNVQTTRFVLDNLFASDLDINSHRLTEFVTY